MTNVRKGSAQLLHFVTAIDDQNAMLSFCCESQPLATVRSHGLPKGCPFCQQENPVSTGLSMRKDGNHQEKI
jgi:hypothetical protein